MRQYKALIFDLCDTIIPYRNDRKPKVMIRGKEIHTTSPLLYDYFRTYRTDIPYLTFHDHFVSTTESVIALRVSGKEVIAADRFNLFLDRLEIHASDQRSALHRQFLQIHFSQVANCLFCPKQNRELLITLKERYPIGLITNFDDTDTVYSILNREAIHATFNSILISAEFGLRKPRKEIFLAACQSLKISPSEALFIGDSFSSDIAGAKGVGMDAAWMNPDGASVKDGFPQPEYILSSLLDLKGIL
ncbi:MAG: HAD family hydrolase [Nitrospirae bacterium]|nr:HAD family hydrolase [Candidatus Troglogloeales bacterium]